MINGLIRSILGTVSKSSYLAFTATPFANVFIDHKTTQELLGDDLFPRDYIRTIDAPTNYVGSKAYFGTEEAVDETGCPRGMPATISHSSTSLITSYEPSRKSDRRDPHIRCFCGGPGGQEGTPAPGRCSWNVSRFNACAEPGSRARRGGVPEPLRTQSSCIRSPYSQVRSTRRSGH